MKKSYYALLVCSLMLMAGIAGAAYEGMQHPVDGMLVEYDGCPTTPSANFKYSTVYRGTYQVSPPRCEGTGQHMGVDIPLPSGTDIRCAARGTVVQLARTESEGGAFGVHLIIRAGVPGEGYFLFAYCHLLAESIPAGFELGSEIGKGDVVGRCGSTGNSTGPHLHFQIDRDLGGTHPYLCGLADSGPDDECVTQKTVNPIPFIEAHGVTYDVGMGSRLPIAFQEAFERNGGAAAGLVPMSVVAREGPGELQVFVLGGTTEAIISLADGAGTAYLSYGAIYDLSLIHI